MRMGKTSYLTKLLGSESGGSYVPKSGNIIYVLQESDFGTVTPGVKIDTIPNTTFVLNAPVVQTLPLVIPTGSSFQLLTANRILNTLTYTNTVSAQFQGINVGLFIFDVVLDGNSTAETFDIDGGTVSLKFPDFNKYNSIGTIKNIDTLYCPGVFFEVISAGLNLIDCEFCTFADCFISALSGNAFTFFNISGANSGDIQIFTALMDNNTFSSFIYIDGATYPTTHTINIAACNILNETNFYGFGSITQEDIRLILRGNKGSQDSITSGAAFLANNALITDIPAVNALVIINGATWTGDAESRILIGSDGGAKYTDSRGTTITIDGDVSLEPLTATKELTTQFIQLAAERFPVSFTNGTNLINETGTALVNNDIIMFKNTAGTLPVELREDVIYYVVNKAVNSFQVSYISGGSVVIFTDDGAPVNSYALSSLHGSSPQNTIAANTPRSLTPQALKKICCGDKIYLTVSNKTDAVNILVNESYFRIID